MPKSFTLNLKAIFTVCFCAFNFMQIVGQEDPDAPVFVDGIFKPIEGKLDPAYPHSTGTKQYTWFRLSYGDTDHRSGTPNADVVNSLNVNNYLFNRASYGRVGFNQLTVINMKLDLTYAQARASTTFGIVVPFLDSLNRGKHIIYDTKYKYYRLFVEGQDDIRAKRYYLKDVFDPSNDNHFYFQANTKSNSWVGALGGNRFYGGDTQTAFYHEVGHNFGLGHNPRIQGKFAPGEKERLGWFQSQKDYINVYQSGDYIIALNDQMSDAIKGLRLYRRDGSSFFCIYKNPSKYPLYQYGLFFRNRSIMVNGGHDVISTDAHFDALDIHSDQVLERNYPPILELGRSYTFIDHGITITPTKLIPNSKGLADRIKIHVELDNDPSANHPPTVQLPTFPHALRPGEEIILTARAADVDKDTLHYAWKVNGLFQRGNYDTASFTFSERQEGQYLVEVLASDVKGGHATATTLIQVGAAQAGQKIYKGTILDDQRNPVPNARVALVQRFKPVPAAGFEGKIDLYLRNNEHMVKDDREVKFKDYRATVAKTGQVDTINHYTDPDGAAKIFSAQWNGKIKIPAGGAYLSTKGNQNDNYHGILIIDANRDNTFSFSADGGDLFTKSKTGRGYTHPLFVPQGTYSFAFQFSDKKGGSEFTPAFGLLWDKTNPNNREQILVERSQQFFTNPKGEYSIFYTDNRPNVKYFVNVFHNDYEIDKSDMSNLKIRKKLTVHLITGANGTTFSKRFLISRNQSSPVVVTPNHLYKLHTVQIGSTTVNITDSKISTPYTYTTPPITSDPKGSI